MTEEQVYVLMAKHLRGDATPDEAATLDAWLIAHPVDQTTLLQLEKVWRLSSQVASGADAWQPDVAAAWERFKVAVDFPASEVANPPVIPLRSPAGGWRVPVVVWRVAAAAVLLLGAAWWAWRVNEPTPTLTRATADTTQLVVLPDSSRVYLNRRSQLRYPARFAATLRTVELTGEAFFEVTHRPDQPFVVQAGGAQTRVLGTTFGVRTAGGRVFVQVTTGKVSFSARHAAARVTLTGGRRAELSADNQLSASLPADPNALAWHAQQLHFDHTPLTQVVASLQRYFRVPITLGNPALANCRFTGHFDRPALAEVLAVLGASVNVTARRQGTAYLLDGTGCTD